MTRGFPVLYKGCSTDFRHLPREVDPLVYNMSIEDPGDVSYNQVGGLGEQIRELREVTCVAVVVVNRLSFKPCKLVSHVTLVAVFEVI